MNHEYADRNGVQKTENGKSFRFAGGIWGLIVADALGVPVEFMDRESLRSNPVISMREYGTHHQPAGTWSDDTSMMLATLDSLKNGYDPDDIMDKFAAWMIENEHTPHGEVFDIGIATSSAIMRYLKNPDVKTCGGMTEWDNGNGSLMRILPVCLYGYQQEKTGNLSEMEVLQMVHEVSGLTHNHWRSKIGCGLYYFCVKEILDGQGNLAERLQAGLNKGFTFYQNLAVEQKEVIEELAHYGRLRDLEQFALCGEAEIKSGGYVVHTLEAVLWCLLNTINYRECVLKAVNLGDDTDTVGAIAGSLAGLWYGYEDIPEEWLEVIARREWIEGLCNNWG